MATYKLTTIAEYWRVDNLTGNDGIQNTVIHSEHSDRPRKFEFFRGGVE